MGRLLRRYWIPALLSWELPRPDCAPVRVRLLGEDRVAFRDTQGRVGLLGEHCPHRGASLFWGFSRDGGLRCVYHGWKYDVDGACIDMPNEPKESDFKHKVHHTAYACREQAGVIWTYMGPKDRQPGLPELEWAFVPEDQAYASKRLQECNWVQAMEGGIDSSHISFLHRDSDRPFDKSSPITRRYIQGDGAPRFEVVDTPYGLMIGARRIAEEDSYYWRISQWLLPWYSMVPASGDNYLDGHAWVPCDDEHCWTWSFSWHPLRPLTAKEREEIESGYSIHTPVEPGSFRSKANKDNNYLIDRERQLAGTSFTGMWGLGVQDQAIQESLGQIFDRTRERLGSTDLAIIQMRKRLLDAANDLREGADPPALEPSLFRVRSAGLLLPRDTPSWPEAAQRVIERRPGAFVASA